MQAKGNEINGLATVSSVGTTACGGPHETPIVRFYFRETERTYRWISELAGSLDLQPGQTINIRAFVRQDGKTVYRVTVQTVAPSPLA